MTDYNRSKNNGFSIASLVCGITSIVVCCLGLSLPLGALGILFAVLNHRKGQSPDSMTTAGIITSCIGLILGLVISICVLFVPTDDTPSIMEEFNSTYNELLEEYYGIEFE